MDSLLLYELNDILDNLPYYNRTGWEMCRFSTYASVQMNSRKKIEQKDILSFPWETSEAVTDITNNDIERLERMSLLWKSTILKELNSLEKN